MIWHQLSLIANQKDADPIANLLEETEALSVSFLEADPNAPIYEPAPGEIQLWPTVKILALFDSDRNFESLAHRIQTQFGYTCIFSEFPDQVWEKSGQEFEPMCFGERLWVCSTHAPIPGPGAVLRLDPGLAFGTGTHPTTALCLTQLTELSLTDQPVLDYGCGSGILGIAAILLGAKNVTGVDYDPQALTSTRNNAEKNNVSDKIQACLPDNLVRETYPIIVANILALPLISLVHTFLEHLTTDGKIILSGILHTQLDMIQAAYQPYFDILAVHQKEEWLCIVAQKRTLHATT